MTQSLDLSASAVWLFLMLAIMIHLKTTPLCLFYSGFVCKLLKHVSVADRNGLDGVLKYRMSFFAFIKKKRRVCISFLYVANFFFDIVCKLCFCVWIDLSGIFLSYQ